MITNHLKSRRGFTLVELLLFSAIFAMVTVAFVGIFIVITRIQSRESSAISLSQESQFLIQKIQALVQESSVIEMNTDQATTTIILRMASSAKDPTYIYIVSSTGQVFLKETATGTPQPLISDRVTLSSGSFVKRSNPYGYDSLSISLTIADNSSSSQKSRSHSIATSIARNTPASFDSDIVPTSSFSVKLGTGFDNIESINRTLFFNGGYVGVSNNGETPTQRLQIGDGGLRFKNVPTRPDCTSAIRGTLWFVENTTSSDSLSVCFLSASGAYYWAEGGSGERVTSTVDNWANVGTYAAVTAAKNNTNYIYASYYDQTNNDLRFSSTTLAGVWSFPHGMVVDSSTANVGQDTAIVAPTTSTIYIAYYDVSSSSLKLASSANGGSSWGVQTVDNAANVGQFASIAAPTTSTIYIAYYDATSNDLLFIKSSDGGGSWSSPYIIDSVGNVGRYTSIVSPQVDSVYICYYDVTNRKPKFAWSTNYGSAPWTTFVLDPGINGGAPCSISAPSTSTIFVSYYDVEPGGDFGSLKFIRSLAGPSQTAFESPQFVDPGTSEGKWQAIASVDQKRVFIAYHGYDIGHYVRWAFSELGGASGTWSTSTAVSPNNFYPGYGGVVATAIDNTTYISLYRQTIESNSPLNALKAVIGSPVFY